MSDEVNDNGGSPDNSGGVAPEAGTAPRSFTEDQVKEIFNTGKWREYAPEDIASSPQLAKFNNRPFWEVPKSYINLEKGYGDRIPRPKEEFGKKEWDEWNKEYNPGYPEDPTKYGLGKPEGFEEDYPYNAEEQQYFERLAHENGLSIQQAKRLWEGMHRKSYDVYKSQTKALEEMKKSDKTKLVEEWGSAYEDKLASARRWLNEYADQEFLDSMKGQHVSAAVWKMISKAGENMSEGKLEKKSSSSASLTPKEALSKGKELMVKAHEAQRKGDRIASTKLTTEATKYFEMSEKRYEG